MVERDVCNQAEFGGDDVGAVEASAKTYLDNCHIDLLFGKIAECHHGCQFEEGGVFGLQERIFVGHPSDHIVVADGLTVDAYAFVEVEQVRRREESDLVAGFLQDAGQRVAAAFEMLYSKSVAALPRRHSTV